MIDSIKLSGTSTDWTDSLTAIEGAVPVHAMKACKGIGGIAPLLHKKKCVGQLSAYRVFQAGGTHVHVQYGAPAVKKKKEAQPFAPHGVFVLRMIHAVNRDCYHTDFSRLLV